MIHQKYQSMDVNYGPHASAAPESTRDAAAAKAADPSEAKGNIADFSEIEIFARQGGADKQSIAR